MSSMRSDQPVYGAQALGELDLVAAAVGLGAATVLGWSDAEQRLAEQAGQAGLAGQAGPGFDIDAVGDEIRRGGDPLGAAFCALRDPARRRPLGQTFTPAAVIESMVSWAAGTGGSPARVVDPGAGSARFLIAAGRQWPMAGLVGVEIDPLAAIIGRASLAAAGLGARSQIILGDYREVALPPGPASGGGPAGGNGQASGGSASGGPTLFLGNPPYVRHHQIAPEWKDWLRRTAAEQGLPASGLAGLHVHFFLATARHAQPGDLGALITAAEWLDVNYGHLVRDLLLGVLGADSVHLVEPAVPVFADATATSVISCFRPGQIPGVVRLARVASPADLGTLDGGRPVPAEVLRDAPRWGPLLRRSSLSNEPVPADGVAAGRGAARRARPARGVPGARRVRPGLPDGHVELGELCRVHRGQVTGANAVWVTAKPQELIPDRFQFPAVTRARELFAAGGALPPGTALRRVIDLPADLAELSDVEQAAVGRFLRSASAAGAADGYVARHRTPWWRVRLANPPPILASYMARRPPIFVRNLAGARFLNIAHGLYPREPLSPALLDALAGYLSRSVHTGQGRVYAGGLVKFEPKEMERLPVPTPELLDVSAGGGDDFSRLRCAESVETGRDCAPFG
jgi:adenine-specific DNA-methyltransferase